MVAISAFFFYLFFFFLRVPKGDRLETRTLHLCALRLFQFSSVHDSIYMHSVGQGGGGWGGGGGGREKK